MLLLKKFAVRIALLLYVVSVPACVFAQGASLFISPTSGTYPIGEPFTVEVRINTGGNAVGTANATLAYDPSDASFVAVSDEGSVFSTILVDSSRQIGRIDLSGLVTNGKTPFTGEDGLFARVTFTPLRNVTTQFHFESGAATAPLSPLGASVGSLANILSKLQIASYSFVPKQTEAASVIYTSTQQVSADETFEITPLPVPNNEWFGTTSVKLSWSLPEGATEMRTLVSSKPEDVPTKVYQVPVNSVTIPEISEGKQYFLLQFKFNGEWGSVIKYPLNVDLTAPGDVVVKETQREDTSDPRVSFAIETTDELSGIQKYEMSIDGGESTVWEKKENELYQPEGLTPGEHVLTVTAFDHAGNTATADLLFLVQSLDAPVLRNESVPERVLTGDTVTIKGTSYPNSEVTVYISYNDGEATEKKVTTDGAGEFTATITEGARVGKYTMWFTVKDERGAMSPNSIKRSINVSQPYIMLFGSQAVTYLSVIVPLVGLIFLLALMLWLAFTWVRGYRKRVKLETNEAYHTTREEFTRLRDELIRQIGMLEKANQSRELTREEMRIFTELSKRLDKMEEHIIQEIEDVENVQEDVVTVERNRTIEGSLEKYRKNIQVTDQTVDASHVLRL